MEFKVIEELDNDKKGIVELVEDETGKQFIRRTMNGKISVYSALKHLSHKFLPRIFSADYNGDNTVVIEEYIKSRGDMLCLETEREKVTAFCELCEVLDYIHERDIIHRDIKPSNILIGEDGHIRLIDFDAARHYKEDSSTDTRYLGTKGYAAPEQFGFSQTGHTADIYALGVTMKTVFGRLSDSIKYRSIIRKCTEFDPVNRYRSASAVKLQLKLAGVRVPAMCGMSAVFLCALALIGSVLLNNGTEPLQSEYTPDVSSLTAAVSESTAALSEEASETTESTMKETASETEISETTTEASQTTAVTELSLVETELSVKETTSETTTQATQKTVVTETSDAETAVDFSAANLIQPRDAAAASDEKFKLISPANKSIIPAVAKIRLSKNVYTDYYTDGFRFVSDENILGGWLPIGGLDTFDPMEIRERFLKDGKEVCYYDNPVIQRIDFYDTGFYDVQFRTYSSWNYWSYGTVLNNIYGECDGIGHYYIYRFEGSDYLFLQFKTSEFYTTNDTTGYSCIVFVREQRTLLSPLDPEDVPTFTKTEIGMDETGNPVYRDIADKEYKFRNDPELIGEWEVIDYVNYTKGWTYDKSRYEGDLWLKGLLIENGGSGVLYCGNNLQESVVEWTYGVILTGGFAEKYTIYNINGEKFLFVEFKNGDYERNKDYAPRYYVFKKK